MIRVAQVITRLIVGGAQEHTIQTVAGLRATGRHSADLITGPTFGPEGSFVPEARRLGVEPQVIASLRREVNPFLDPIAYRRLVTIFRRRQYHVVHTNSSKAGILGRLAARKAAVPLVVHTVHGWGHHDRQNPILRRLFIRLERACADFSDGLVVVSPRNMEKGLRDGIGTPEKYVTIRSGVDLSRYAGPRRTRAEVRRELGIPEDASVIGTVTRLSPQKAPQVFVDAAAAVVRDEPGTSFVVVGDGPLGESVKRLAARLGIDGAVRFTGLRSDVPDLLGAFDIFVLSSLWEGLPRAIPEAMVAGLPVIASAVDGNAEVVEPGVTGLLVPPGNPSALAEAELVLLRDPDLAARMGRAGRERVQAFDVRRMIEDTVALYDRLIDSKGVRLK